MANCWHENEVNYSTFINTIPDIDSWYNLVGYLDENGNVSVPSASGVKPVLVKEAIEEIYYLILGTFANSHLKYKSAKLASGGFLSVINSFGPSWWKQRSIELKLANYDINDKELLDNGISINSSANNPSTEISYDSNINYIDYQQTARSSKSKIEGITTLYNLLDSTNDDKFLGRFKACFLKYPIINEDGTYYE